MTDNTHHITVDDITACWAYHKDYLADILNGEYPVETAREDLLSLIGSEFDKRTPQTTDSAK